MTRIVIADTPENSGRDLSIEREILGPGIELVEYVCDGSEENLANACRHADGIITAYSPFTAPVIAQLSQCRFISVMATGFDSIDLEAAEKANIRVAVIDEYCTDEVADHAVLLMLSLSRQLMSYHHSVQEQHQWRFDQLTGLKRMSELTLGIIGFGRIGQAVARRARGFGISLLAFDPCPDEGAANALDVQFCTLAEIYAQADIISLNCGLTADNKHLIDSEAFAQMKRKPVLINCARGALVDEEALIDALDNGQISGAGLDVLASESPDLEKTGLLARANVILTPHVAFYSDASMLDNRRISTRNVSHFFAGNQDKVRRFVL